MQIGQLLVEQGWVDPAALARALVDQPQLGRRICSLLILRGELDADNAARALSQQHGVPGVLQRHVEHRDLSLPPLLPAELAREHVALPIGRTSTGALIVCVRDPSPAVHAAITAAVTGRVVIAVAPAYQLEHLVAETYNAGPDADDLVLELAVPGRPAEFLHPGRPPAPTDGDIDVDLSTRQIPVIGDPLDHLGTMTLVELDDARVAKDPSQSGQHEALLPRTATGVGLPSTVTGSSLPPRTVTTSYPPPRTVATSSPPPRTTTSSHPPPRPAPYPAPYPAAHPSPRSASPSGRPSGGTLPLGFRGPPLDASVAAIEGAGSGDEIADAAMYYLAGRFHRAVWFAIHEGAALGERGHGDQLTPEVIHAISVPLAAPSILQLAHATRQLATAPPPDAGAIQDRLWRLLGAPRAIAAIPIETGARIGAVIAVGDPIGDPATAPVDLERLGRALGAAFRRIAAR